MSLPIIVTCTKIITNRPVVITLLPLLLLFFTVSPLHAQEPVVQFEHITLDNGLSDNTVYSIVQDNAGFIWFGTQNGLNKFDGYDFTVYKNDPFNENSITNDNAGNLHIDQEGNIWIGTWGGGVNRLNPKTGKFTNFQNNPDNPQSLSHNRVQTIFQDHSGTVWIGTSGGGLNKFNAKTETFTRYKNNPDDLTSLSNDRIWHIDQDRQGNLWIATSNGLNKFNPQTEQFIRYKQNYKELGSLSHNLVRTLYVDKNDTLWVGTEKGLNKFNPETEEFKKFFNDRLNPQSLNDDIINVIFEDSAGRFWVGTRSGGLNLLDQTTEKFTPYLNDPLNPESLSYNDIRDILEDRSGVLWFSTRGGGVNKLVPTSGQFIHFANIPGKPNSLNNNEVRAIYKDQDGTLWIGTKGGGLNIYNPETKTFSTLQNNASNYNSLSNDDVYAIIKDSSGIFWFGTSGGGLSKFNPQTKQFTRYQHLPSDPNSLSSNDINTIIEDINGKHLWIGTKGGGLNKFQPENGQFTRYEHIPHSSAGLTNNDVYAIYQNPNGVLWIGTYGGGLNKLNAESGQITAYQHNPDNPTSLSDNNIYTIYSTDNDTLWIGTANGGLNKFNPQTGKTLHFTQKDGLASDVVYSIQEDDTGNLWLSTNKGLSKFYPADQHFSNYDSHDGLERTIYREGAAAAGRDGALYFGGINGLTKFYPDQIMENINIPPIVLTGFNLFNQPLDLGLPPHEITDIELSYKDDVLSFNFAALDYTDPTKNQYAYKLEGFDDDWIYTGSRPFASYTNLDPGQYTLKINGSNNAGIWNEEGTPINIIITPPFWETWWFRTLVLLTLIGLVVAISHIRVRAIEQNRKVLKEQVTERTAALVKVNQHLQEVTDRLQSELALAQEIQQGLLPPPRPNWFGPEIICYSKPANEVGGDFYDYYAFATSANGLPDSQPGHRFAVVVGDVSGKGMPAALLMAVSLGSLQSILSQEPQKEELLARLDKSLQPYTKTTNQNCAFCYTEIRGHTLSVLNAGGISPIIRQTNGSTYWVDAVGLPLGVSIDNRFDYRDATVTVSPNDMAIMVSDGVIEAMNANREMFGFERLEQAIATGPATEAEAMLVHLQSIIKNFMGEVSPHDDLTIVVMKI